MTRSVAAFTETAANELARNDTIHEQEGSRHLLSYF